MLKKLALALLLLLPNGAFAAQAKKPVVKLPAAKVPAAKQQASPEPAVKLMVNGKVIPGNLLTVKGRLYVAVQDLAEGLNYAVRNTRDRIELIDVDVQMPIPGSGANTGQAAKKEVEKPGSVGGVITYYFNSNYGNKPDVGAQVWLIAGSVDMPEDCKAASGIPSMLFFLRGADGAQSKTYDAAKYAVADGGGRYEIPGVPPGNYTLVANSRHTNSEKQLLGKVYSSRITVRPGERVDVSWDFGMTYVR